MCSATIPVAPVPADRSRGRSGCVGAIAALTHGLCGWILAGMTKFWGAPGPNLLAPHGGFEIPAGHESAFTGDVPGDKGAMWLYHGFPFPPGWFVNGTTVQWLTKQTNRYTDANDPISPLEPAEGIYFLDLTGNGAGVIRGVGPPVVPPGAAESGGVITRVPIKLGA